MPYLRYDVFYAAGDMDASIPLPAKAERGAVAVCTNGEREWYVAEHGQWTKASEEGARRQMEANKARRRE